MRTITLILKQDLFCLYRNHNIFHLRVTSAFFAYLDLLFICKQKYLQTFILSTCWNPVHCINWTKCHSGKSKNLFSISHSPSNSRDSTSKPWAAVVCCKAQDHSDNFTRTFSELLVLAEPPLSGLLCWLFLSFFPYLRKWAIVMPLPVPQLDLFLSQDHAFLQHRRKEPKGDTAHATSGAGSVRGT